MRNFKSDLQLGEKAQDYIIKAKSKEHKGLKQVEGNFKEYDLIAEDGYTAEVKFDILSRETQKVGIEYECNNQKSGIARTKAYEWIHFYKLYNDWVYSTVNTSSLKSFLKSNWNSLDKVNGGDSNTSKMVLVSVYDFADTFGFEKV